MSNPTDPIVLGDEGVLELGVVVSPLLAAGELGVCLISVEKGIFHFFLSCKKRNLDLSDVAGATHDCMNVLLTDVVVVAHRGGHLGRALSQQLLVFVNREIILSNRTRHAKSVKIREVVPKKAAVFFGFCSNLLICLLLMLARCLSRDLTPL